MRPSGQPTKAPARRTVGLDKPCSMCGSPIYYNYKGPIDHICGKCTDQLRRRLNPRAASPATGIVRTAGRRGFGWIALFVAALCGAAIAVLLLHSGLLAL